MMPLPKDKLLFLTERESWRTWLQDNYQSETEIWLVYAKKHTGEPRISYNDAVEEALCFGWVDSTVRTVDADHFAQRFSLRRPGASFSQPNKERLRVLIERGKVREEILPTLPDVSGEDFEIPADILEAVRANEKAWEHFQAFSPPYIRIRVAYIDQARGRPEEFEKRLANFIGKTEQNTLIGYGGIDKHY